MWAGGMMTLTYKGFICHLCLNELDDELQSLWCEICVEDCVYKRNTVRNDYLNHNPSNSIAILESKGYVISTEGGRYQLAIRPAKKYNIKEGYLFCIDLNNHKDAMHD